MDIQTLEEVLKEKIKKIDERIERLSKPNQYHDQSKRIEMLHGEAYGYEKVIEMINGEGILR